MKTIFVDIGNSFIKAAEKTGTEWQTVYSEECAEKEAFYHWIDQQAGSRLLVCSVHREISRELDRQTFAPDIRRLHRRDLPADLIVYETPHTLGLDRYFACLGASDMVPGAVVVIDAGTACTIDYMSAGGIFHGGVIMPGLEMLRRVFDKQIPALSEPGYTIPKRWPGGSTSESVGWGTIGLFREAVSGFLERYRRDCGDFDLFLTGGASRSVAAVLENGIPLRERPFLVFEGMDVARLRFGL